MHGFSYQAGLGLDPSSITDQVYISNLVKKKIHYLCKYTTYDCLFRMFITIKSVNLLSIQQLELKGYEPRLVTKEAD